MKEFSDVFVDICFRFFGCIDKSCCHKSYAFIDFIALGSTKYFSEVLTHIDTSER